MSGEIQAGEDGVVSPAQIRAMPPERPAPAPTPIHVASLGRIAYQAHVAQLPAMVAPAPRTSSRPIRRAVPIGDTLPWDELTEGQRAHWMAVARAVAGAVEAMTTRTV